MPNLTIRNRDEDLVRKAKALAAGRGLSLSALVRAHLEELVERDDDYEAARRRALGMLRRGLASTAPFLAGSSTMTEGREGRVFVDTNPLIHALSDRGGEKRRAARALIERLWKERSGVSSVQVFSGAAAALRGKAGLPRKRIRAVLVPYLPGDVVALEPGDVPPALEISGRHRISIRDAWIVRAAVKAGAAILATEDSPTDGKWRGSRSRAPLRRPRAEIRGGLGRRNADCPRYVQYEACS